MDKKIIELIAEVIFAREELRKEEQACAHVFGCEFKDLKEHQKLSYRLKAEAWLDVLDTLKIRKEIILEDRLRKYGGYPPYNKPDNPWIGNKDYLKDIHSKHTEAAITRTFLMISEMEMKREEAENGK